MNLKKTIAAIAATVMIFPFAMTVLSSAAEEESMTEIFSEDFEGYEVGDVPKDGFDAVVAGEGNSLTVQENDEAHGKVARLYDTGPGINSKLVGKLQKERGIITWQFDYKDYDENAWSQMFIRGNNSELVALKFIPWAIDGGRGFHCLTYQYKDKKGILQTRGLSRIYAGRWNRITFILDTQRCVWSFYWDGVQMVGDEPFLNKSATIEELIVNTNPWGGGRIWIDNFKVFKGTPDAEKLGIKMQKRSEEISYGDKLIAEPGNRVAGEDLIDWMPHYDLGASAGTVEDNGEVVFKLSNTKIKKQFTEQSKAVKMSLDFKESSVASSSEILIRNDLAPLVQINLRKRDGKSYLSNVNIDGTLTEYVEAEIGKWHHLEVVLDIEKSIYDIYFNGKKVANGVFAREFSDTANIFAIYAGGNADTYALSVKNIVVTEKNVESIDSEQRPPDVFENNVPKLEGKPTYDNFKGITYLQYRYKNAEGRYDLNAIAEDIKIMKDSGVHWARIGIDVDSNIDDMDSMIDMFYENDIALVGSVEKKNPTNQYGTEEQEAENAEGYKRIVDRYKDKIHDWEIGNEPNLGQFWRQTPVDAGGTGNKVNDYVLHCKNFYTAAKEADPNCNVILGGVSEWLAEDFIDEFGKFEGYKYIDEVCLHPYANTPGGVVGRIQSVKEHIAMWPEPYNYFPMWITEVGFHTELTWTVPSTVPDDVIKANYVQSTFEGIWKEMGEDVRPICWYSYMEPSSAAGYGLVRVWYSKGERKCEPLLALSAYAAVDDVTPRVKVPNVVKKPTKTEETPEATPIPEENLEKVTITINGEEIEEKGYIRGKTVFLPMRAVFENVGAQVSWNESENAAEVILDNGNSMVCLTGKAAAILNGLYVKTDAAAEVSRGITMIPLRLAEKTLETDFEYSSSQKTVEIVTK